MCLNVRKNFAKHVERKVLPRYTQEDKISIRQTGSLLFPALQLGPVQQPVRGCPGDPALPAPLSSRVSLLQCSNFSINPKNCYKAAIFANCTRAANCTATAIEAPRCRTNRRTCSFSTEFPSIPPSSKSIPTLTHILLTRRDSQLRNCVYASKQTILPCLCQIEASLCSRGVKIVSLAGLF